jgi:hypothetical protein
LNLYKISFLQDPKFLAEYHLDYQGKEDAPTLSLFLEN